MAYQPPLSSTQLSGSPYLEFTQHQLLDKPTSRPTTPLTPRSPFVPVKKHRTDTPPNQAVDHFASAAGTHAGPGSGLGAGTALRPSTKDNLLPLANTRFTQSPKPIRSTLSPGLPRTAPSHSLASAAAGPSHSTPAGALPSSAPKIRARLTPAAAPRRKCLPGTEDADVPTRSPERAGPMAPPPLPLVRAKPPAFHQAAGAYTPQQYDSGASVRSAGGAGGNMSSPIGLGFGGFPGGGGGGMGGLGAAMGAISLDHEPSAGRRAAGKDNVLVCVR